MQSRSSTWGQPKIYHHLRLLVATTFLHDSPHTLEEESKQKGKCDAHRETMFPLLLCTVFLFKCTHQDILIEHQNEIIDGKG